MSKEEMEALDPKGEIFFVSHFGEQTRYFRDLTMSVTELELAENEEIKLCFGELLVFNKWIP
jgi:hypothetical protein